MTLTHLSYSQLSTYNACPRSHYLSRLKQAEGLPAWYFAVGTSVHRWIEGHLMGWYGHGEVSIDDIFNREVLDLREIEPDTTLWLHGGSKDEPVVEERALKLAQDCVSKAQDFLEDFEVWYVEPEITGHLPGCTLPIKAFPDALGEHKKHGPAIVDWKTGKTKPKDTLQLETYNALLSLRPAPSPRPQYKGLWVMLNPDAPQARPVALKKTVEEMGAIYGELERKIRKGVYPAMAQFNCKFCTMLPNCELMSGSTERTRYYDTPEKDGVLPF